VDLSCEYDPISSRSLVTPQLHTSNPARIFDSIGGVGRNVAVALHHMGANVRLCSAVGDDSAGIAAKRHLEQVGMNIDDIHTIRDSNRTSRYIALNDRSKNLFIGIADMQILEDQAAHFNDIWAVALKSRQPKWVVLDGNWDEATLKLWIDTAHKVMAKIAFEPVSVEKSTRLIGAGLIGDELRIDLATPNEEEMQGMHLELVKRQAGHQGPSFGVQEDPTEWQVPEDLNDISTKCVMLLSLAKTIVCKLGSRGVILAQRDGLKSSAAIVRHIPVPEQVPEKDISSVNGVGDTFLGALVAGLARKNPKPIEELIYVAQMAAAMTLRSPESVSAEIAALKTLL